VDANANDPLVFLIDVAAITAAPFVTSAPATMDGAAFYRGLQPIWYVFFAIAASHIRNQVI
jgi:hypothetical protein